MVVFNFFRLSGDLIHVASIFLLLKKIIGRKNCAGISLKTQILYATVFTSRYLDIFTNTYSPYNTILKIVYLVSTYYTIYLIARTYKTTYDAEHDSFNPFYLIVPSAIIGFAISADHTSISEVLWTFSIVLESVAILPQIFLLQKTGAVENITADYIVCLGTYRALYIMNWVYRYITEPGYSAWTVWIFGSIQTLMYADFFYFYAKSRIKGEELVLPA